MVEEEGRGSPSPPCQDGPSSASDRWNVDGSSPLDSNNDHDQRRQQQENEQKDHACGDSGQDSTSTKRAVGPDEADEDIKVGLDELEDLLDDLDVDAANAEEGLDESLLQDLLEDL